jgi:mannose-1-phosphate guanylyltransferase / mannose-6-phosphate isomerase
MNSVFPVILCGGSGTRLWPLSRAGFPKQFLILPGDEVHKSLFQQATERIQSVVNDNICIGPTIVVANEEHRFLVLEQLRELSNIHADLILEPSGKNTAPALTLAALDALNHDADPILMVTPADQVIKNGVAFIAALQKAIDIASNGGVAIFGIAPTTAESGYGYIKANKLGLAGEVHGVERFVEKPDAATAKQYIEEGQYFWNSGMIVLKATVWLAALKEFRPEIFLATQKAWNERAEDINGETPFIRPDKDIFNGIASESIDCAVIERCSDKGLPIGVPIKMVELDAGWSDLGSWDALWQVGRHDPAGNIISGDVLLYQSKNSLVHASSRLVSAAGIDNLVIVETADVVLVIDKSLSQDVKHIVHQLSDKHSKIKNQHRKVSRPWGSYDNIDEDALFKVKRIQVKPGASLSLQMHRHRAEHWIVVSGVAEITNGDQVFTLLENQSTYIPKGQLHRLANTGKDLLEIIEVQSGNYLEEDDIVRFEDVYGRT